MNNLRYNKSYPVHSYETDTKGFLAATGLMNFLQDIASHHASILKFGKDDLEKENRFWVLSRIVVNIERLPVWNDEIIVSTWPRGIEKLFAIRDFEVKDQTGNNIATAVSCWLMVDIESRRPVRPDSLLEKMNGLPGDTTGGAPLPSKLRPASPYAYKSPSINVKYSDLDINMHVNNVKYLQWALDIYPLDHLHNNRINTIEVNFLSETVPGESITLSSEEDEDGFHHTVFKSDGKTEACRIRLEWEPCSEHKVY